MLCLNSAQTEINCCCFCKVVWWRYLGEVGKFLSYFVANLSKTLHINFYQIRLSIVEVMIKKIFGVFFYASQCITITDSYRCAQWLFAVWRLLINCQQTSFSSYCWSQIEWIVAKYNFPFPFQTLNIVLFSDYISFLTNS